jgi:hypothetical protein
MQVTTLPRMVKAMRMSMYGMPIYRGSSAMADSDRP